MSRFLEALRCWIGWHYYYLNASCKEYEIDNLYGGTKTVLDSLMLRHWICKRCGHEHNQIERYRDKCRKRLDRERRWKNEPH